MDVESDSSISIPSKMRSLVSNGTTTPAGVGAEGGWVKGGDEADACGRPRQRRARGLTGTSVECACGSRLNHNDCRVVTPPQNDAKSYAPSTISNADSPRNSADAGRKGDHDSPVRWAASPLRAGRLTESARWRRRPRTPPKNENALHVRPPCRQASCERLLRKTPGSGPSIRRPCSATSRRNSPGRHFWERHLKRERRKSLCRQDYGVFGSTGVASVDLAASAFGNGYGSAAVLAADSITECKLPWCRTHPHRVLPIAPRKNTAKKPKSRGILLATRRLFG